MTVVLARAGAAHGHVRARVRRREAGGQAFTVTRVTYPLAAHV